MEDLKMLKKNLMTCVQSQMMNPQEADTKELGEVIDMIKDLSETMYYCSVAEAMEESKKEKELMGKMPRHYYMPMYYPPYREPMYYDGGSGNSGGNSSGGSSSSSGGNSGGSSYYDGGSMYARGGRGNGRSGGRRGYDEGQIYYESGMSPIPFYEGNYPTEIRDFREGRSGMTRRNYMESKELGHGKEKKMKELEEYMKELSEDITEMVEGASPEEKQILSQKLSTLAEKVQ